VPCDASAHPNNLPTDDTLDNDQEVKILMRGSRALSAAALLAMVTLLAQCSETTSPKPPAAIAIVSGDNQYSLRGTELPEPLTVQVLTDDKMVPENAVVVFTITQGNGVLSQTSAAVDNKGKASTRLTLGMTPGTNLVTAAIAEAPAHNVTFTATAGNFYCQEGEDTLRVCGSCSSSYAPTFQLLLATGRSGLHNRFSGSIVQLDWQAETAISFLEIKPDQGITPIIFDAALSPRGDYYVALRTLRPEILKIDVSGDASHFASLDQSTADDWVEITTYPRGLLAGCDVRGPFIVTCRDTLLRFAEATYVNAANDDAVAADPRDQIDDPLGEDIYFILKSDSTLRRLPLDSLSVEPGGLQTVATLTQEQAEGARGMVCDGFDGTVYILVDTDATKQIVSVDPMGGGATVLYDFFARGAGDAAGIQRDLALRRPFLFTLDTLNDKLILFNMPTVEIVEYYSDSLQQAKLSMRDANGGLTGGERVGLVVLP
jgi:hypothetical protein